MSRSSILASALFGVALTLTGCPNAPDDDDTSPSGDDDDATDDDDAADDDDGTPDDDDVTDDDDATNGPPSAEDDQAITDVGTAVWIDVLDNDVDPNGDELEIEFLANGAHGTTVRQGGGVLYTPDPDFGGVDTFDYLAGDPGGLSDGAQVTVEVSCFDGFELISAAMDMTPGDGASSWTSVSGDGSVVVFVSEASDLVPGDANGVADVFLRDRSTGVTERVSMGYDGSEPNGASQAPDVSDDGAWAAYVSYADNLVEGDTNASRDVFLWSRDTGITIRASITSAGDEASDPSDTPSVSGNGRYVAFTSFAALDPVVLYGTTDVWVYDRLTQDVELISVSLGGTDGIQTSALPSISADGNLVAFSSMAWDLVSGDGDAWLDVFVRDRAAGTTTRVNLPVGVPEATGHSSEPVMAADGGAVVFMSIASNLVVGDTEGALDVMVAVLSSGTVERVSVDSADAAGADDSMGGAISADGRFVAFVSEVELAPTGTPGILDLYVRDRDAGTTAHASVGCGGQFNEDHVVVPIGLASDGSGLVFESFDPGLMAPLPDDGVTTDLFWVPNPLAP